MLKMKDGRSIIRAMLTLAIPISLQNLITFAVNFADNLMIGSLGDTAISAVYMGTQVQTFLQMVVNGISTAMLVIVAQYWGRKDMQRIRIVAGIAMRIVLSVGIVITFVSVMFPREILNILTPEQGVVEAAIPYLRIVGCSYLFFCASQILISMLRGVENARIGMYVSFASLVTNVLLNWVLIFGHLGFPAMGIRGAAIATLISRVLEAVAAAWYVLFVEKRLRWRFRFIFVPGGQLTRDFIRYGAPVIAGDFVWGHQYVLSEYDYGTTAGRSHCGCQHYEYDEQHGLYLDYRPVFGSGHYYRQTGRRWRNRENPPICPYGTADVLGSRRCERAVGICNPRAVYLAV